MRYGMAAVGAKVLIALAKVCAGSPDLNSTLHTFEKRWKGEDIARWANPYNAPVYLYRWNRHPSVTFHMAGVFRVEHPLGVWESAKAFGHDGGRLYGLLKGMTGIKDYRFNNITYPEWTRGYEWEAHWTQFLGTSEYAVFEPLAQVGTPIDWFVHSQRKKERWALSRGESPIFRWISDYDLQKVCEDGPFKNRPLCWQHFRRGCNMPGGRCRRTLEEMDEYRYPRCSILIPPSRTHNSSSPCPPPVVQEFREQLNDVRRQGPGGRFNDRNLYQLGLRFGVAGGTTEDFLRKYGFPALPVDAKRAEDMAFCRYVAKKWASLGFKGIKGLRRVPGYDSYGDCNEILSAVEQMRRSLVEMVAWKKAIVAY